MSLCTVGGSNAPVGLWNTPSNAATSSARKPSTNMAEKGAEGVGEVTAKPTLTAAQKQLNRRRQELDYWKKNSERIRSRNLITGLVIGAFVVGMFSYTILSVKQERILEEIDDEARINIIRGPRTGANS